MKEEPGTNSTSSKTNSSSYLNEIGSTFPSCHRIAGEHVGSRYILDISATSETNPFIAVALSNHSTQVYDLRDNRIAKISSFAEHSKAIVNCKFSPLNNNLLYTASNDGTVKLWDLRETARSAITFRDTTLEKTSKTKPLSSFDVSPCDRLLAAGTDLVAGDAFILFWDVRNTKFMGAYWESHTDDIVQVHFQPDNSNKLMSGSTDGLITIYDLCKTREEEAFQQCLNTDAFVDSLLWFLDGNKWKISCVTSENELQLWELDGAEPYQRLTREKVALEIKEDRKNLYIAKCHSLQNALFVLCGANNPGGGSPLRSIVVSHGRVVASWQFPQNVQHVRASYLNEHTNLLLTGGEKGNLDIWKLDLSQVDVKFVRL